MIDCAGEGSSVVVGAAIVSISGVLARGALVTNSVGRHLRGVAHQTKYDCDPETQASDPISRLHQSGRAGSLIQLEAPDLWAAIHLEHQPIGQFQNG